MGSVVTNGQEEPLKEDEKDEVYDRDEWFLDEVTEEEEKRFEVLEKDQVKELFLSEVGQVAGMLEVGLGEASLLLRLFQWSVERFQNKYFDDPSKYNAAAGVVVSPKGGSQEEEEEPEEFECAVCMEDVPYFETFALGCGHRFCADCWQGHLKTSLDTLGANCVKATCMTPDCVAVVPYTAWERLAVPEVCERYWYFLLKDFVEQGKQCVFCVNPQCGRVIHCRGAVPAGAAVVECECGARFCFHCGQEKHNPATCEQLARWQKRMSNDDESLKMIRATTKPCFHCGWPTERNKGCNHMTCSKCGGQWCWMCRGDWATHGQHTGGFYSCNRYDKSEAKKIDDWAASYLKSSERYQHYYTRYFNHDSARRELETQAAKMHAAATATAAVPAAAVAAVECRNVLKYTYVYGFFMESDGASPAMRDFFEYLQGNAEGITERLCELLGDSIDKIDLAQLRDRVNITKKYFSNLVTGIEEGLVPK